MIDLPDFKGGLDYEQVKEISMAVFTGKTKSYWLAQVAQKHSLLKMGVTITLDDLLYTEASALMLIEQKSQEKSERDAKLKRK
jgi:hypothetical protein